MAFNASNHNLSPSEEALAQDLNNVYEAIADGLDVADDTGPIFQGLLGIAGKLRGKSLSEIKLSLAKAAVANVFDELAEAQQDENPDA